MAEKILVDLPHDLRAHVRKAAQEEGISESAVIVRALRRHLFLARFRQLRAETLAHLHTTGQPDLTDEDVFRIIV